MLKNGFSTENFDQLLHVPARNYTYIILHFNFSLLICEVNLIPILTSIKEQIYSEIDWSLHIAYVNPSGNQIRCLAFLACLYYSFILDNLHFLLIPIYSVILSASQEHILLAAQAWNNLVFQPLNSLVCSLGQLFYCINLIYVCLNL